MMVNDGLTSIKPVSLDLNVGNATAPVSRTLFQSSTPIVKSPTLTTRMETKSLTYQPIQEAIQELLEVIRGRQPGIDSLKAKKLQRRFARELSLYFRQLGRNLPFRDLPGYLKRNAVIKEQADDEALRMATDMTEAMNQRLNNVMRKNIETGFVLGANQAHQIFRLEPTFDLLDDQAVQWMNTRAAEMVTRINEETRLRLADTLSRGARAGDSTATLAKRIRSEVNAMADISKGRAKLIANTELNNAMSEANLQTYNRLGIAAKSWSTVGDDDVSDDCLDNEAAGPIPMDATFPGGVGRPPQHPGCRCTLVPEQEGVPAEGDQSFVPTENFGDVPPETGIEAGKAWENAPDGSTKGINKIELHAEKGELVTFDGQGFSAGDFNGGMGRVRVFDVEGVTKGKIDYILGHEFGHAGYKNIPSSLRVDFVKATFKEKPYSDYARQWFGKVKLTGVNENFAEIHQIFVARDKATLDLMRVAKPRTIKVFEKAWENLGGTKWW